MSDWMPRGVESRWFAVFAQWYARLFGSRKSRLHADARLAADAFAGRVEAMEALIRRVKPEIYKVAKGLRRSFDDPAKLSEAIFIRVFRLLKHYRADVPLEEWTAQIALAAGMREICHSPKRSDRTHWTRNDVALLRRIDRNGENGLTAGNIAEVKRLFERILDRLTPPERLVKRLRELEDCSLEEIRNWTGWSAAKVSRIARKADQHVDAILCEICK